MMYVNMYIDTQSSKLVACANTVFVLGGLLMMNQVQPARTNNFKLKSLETSHPKPTIARRNRRSGDSEGSFLLPLGFTCNPVPVDVPPAASRRCEDVGWGFGSSGFRSISRFLSSSLVPFFFLCLLSKTEPRCGFWLGSLCW